MKHSCTLGAFFKENMVMTEEGSQQMQQIFFGFIIRVPIQAVTLGNQKKEIYCSTIDTLRRWVGTLRASHGRNCWGFNSLQISFIIIRSLEGKFFASNPLSWSWLGTNGLMSSLPIFALSGHLCRRKNAGGKRQVSCGRFGMKPWL